MQLSFCSESNVMFWYNVLQSELSRLADELSQACAQRDEIGIKYNAISERVGYDVHTCTRLLYRIRFSIRILLLLLLYLLGA